MNYIPFSQYLYDYFGTERIRKNEDHALIALVREIDRDNSTNVWRYGNRNQIENIVSYISNPQNDFYSKLKCGDISLPDILASEDVGGSKVKSLSSKICKYLSEFMYQKDAYFINDSFIRHALLFYMDYYGVEKTLSNSREIQSSHMVDSLTYAELHFLLQKLLDKVNAGKSHDQMLTRNEMDHIIWYSYKSFRL